MLSISNGMIVFNMTNEKGNPHQMSVKKWLNRSELLQAAEVLKNWTPFLVDVWVQSSKAFFFPNCWQYVYRVLTSRAVRKVMNCRRRETQKIHYLTTYGIKYCRRKQLRWRTYRMVSKPREIRCSISSVSSEFKFHQGSLCLLTF